MDVKNVTATEEGSSNVEEIYISEHAAVRCQQRGLRPQDLKTISRHADVFIPRGNGAELVRISKTKLGKMGNRTPEGVAVDRLKNTCLLLSIDNTIITVIHPRKGKYKKRKKNRRLA